MENYNIEMPYAIFAFGGKQYQAVEGKTLAVEKINGNVGQEVLFDKVLLVRKDAQTMEIGQPVVSGAVIKAEIVSQAKGPKLIVFKFKRRKRIRVKKGHRQPLTIVRFKTLNSF